MYIQRHDNVLISCILCISYAYDISTLLYQYIGLYYMCYVCVYVFHKYIIILVYAYNENIKMNLPAK